MSTADLFTADFPHGSPAGYDRGCTGSACPNQGDPIFYTCREAKSLKRTDYARRQHPDGEPMKRTTEPTPATEEHSSKPAPTITAEQHGTPYGYQKGCRIEEECPNYGSAAPTCREASRRYQREYAENRKKREAAGLAKPTPAPPSKPLTVEPVSDDAAHAVASAFSPDHDGELAAEHQTIVNLRTALAAAEEATALSTKQRDDALAEGAKLSDALKRLQDEHEAVVADLDQARATQLAETRRADELEEQLDAARQARSQLERVEASYRPDVVPAVTGGDNPPTTVMTVGDVRLELPAGEVAQLKVVGGGVHVQIGR